MRDSPSSSEKHTSSCSDELLTDLAAVMADDRSQHVDKAQLIKEEEQVQFTDFPTDVLLHIASFLYPYEKKKLTQMSKRFRITFTPEVLEPVVNEFSLWMNERKHFKENSPNIAENDELLRRFLTWGPNALRHTRTYYQLCQFAELLKKDGWNISSPPCTIEQFAMILEECIASQLYGDATHFRPFHQIRSKLPANIDLIAIAAERFVSWIEYVQKWWQRPSFSWRNHSEALLKFLDNDNGPYMFSGFRYIKTYEQLCQLAELLDRQGWEVMNPPCTPLQFARAVDNSRHGEISILKTSKEMQIILAADKFVKGVLLEGRIFLMLTNEVRVSGFGSCLFLYQEEESQDFFYYANIRNVVTRLSLSDSQNQLTDIEKEKLNEIFSQSLREVDISEERELYLSILKITSKQGHIQAPHSNMKSCDENNKSLVEFSRNQSVRGFIKTYDELCQLAELLKIQGWNVTSPPCTTEEFAQSIEDATSGNLVPSRSRPRLFGSGRSNTVGIYTEALSCRLL